MTVKLGDRAIIPIKSDLKIWEVVEILPAGQVTLSRICEPGEEKWGDYEGPRQTMKGGERVFCQVASANHLKIIPTPIDRKKKPV